MGDTSQKFSFMSQVHNFTRTKTADNQQIQPKTIQGHISKILPNDFVEFTIDATGPFTLPKLVIPQAFSKYHREPTQVGDKGYVVPNDYAIAGTDGAGGGTASMYGRSNLTSGTYHPISIKSFAQRDQNNFLITGGPTGITAQSADTKTNINIDYAKGKDSIVHNSVLDMLHNVGQDLLHNVERNAVKIAKQVIGNQAATINHVASAAMTIANTNGSINLLQQGLTIAAPSTTSTFDPLQPPTPGGQTMVSIIGSLAASVGISAPSIGIGLPGFEVPPMTQPVPPQLVNARVIVTGSRGGNVALASLLSALVTLGLITDNTII
jgi:hypothetical protein